jgi:hypothetical protein
MRLSIIFMLVCLVQSASGQRSLHQLQTNKEFDWSVDTATAFNIYYLKNSWASEHIEMIQKRMNASLDAVKLFMNMETYSARINLFIVGSREQMKMLVGYETNGSAIYKSNALTGIATEKANSVYANHELFHLIAMNEWGVPETWLNEGMAVYSDKQWYNYDLYELTNYLIDHNRYVPLDDLIKKFRKREDLLSYPLAGSFVRYLDETYGRETILQIWTRSAGLTEVTGKTIDQLEKEWLTKVREFKPTGIIRY